MKKAKKICLLLVVSLILPFLSGCYDSREIDDMAYVIAIGFDKGKTNFLKLTFQIAKPGSGGGGQSSGGGGGKEESSVLTTIEAPTLYSGLDMVNTFVSRQINLSHAVALVFSEELSRQGIDSYIRAIERGREFRPNMYMVVARGSAEDYIRSIKPQLESNPAKYYTLNFEGYKYTAFTANTQLQYFYSDMESLYKQPVAILAGVNKFTSSADFNTDNSTYKYKGRDKPLEGDFKAGDVTKASDLKGETMGLAVFDGSKMVGELDGEETTYYLMSTGEFNYSYISIPDPLAKDKFVLLNTRQSRTPRQSVQIVNGKPIITLKVILEAEFLSIQSGINYEEKGNLTIFEKRAEDFLKSGIIKFLNRSSKELKTDICGFGNGAKGKFLTWQDWDNYNWKSKYKDAAFNVEVDLRVRRPGLLMKSEPTVGSEGKVNNR